MINSIEQLLAVSILPEFGCLNSNDVDIISQELDALEKNPVNGWNVIFPTLYNTLYNITSDLCIKLKCDVPSLFIDFQGSQKLQTSAYLMMDGTAQLHIGIDFIREFLLDKSTDRHIMYRSFKWSIAHELCHICDSNFKSFARSYSFRLFVDRFLLGCFLIGLTSFISGAENILGHANYFILFIISIFFIVLKKVLITFLHRKFEYSADERTVGIIEDFDVQIVKIALTKMTTNIHDFITKSYGNSSNIVAQFFDSFHKKFVLAQSFLLHPSINRRIMRLHSICSRTRILK